MLVRKYYFTVNCRSIVYTFCGWVCEKKLSEAKKPGPRAIERGFSPRAQYPLAAGSERGMVLRVYLPRNRIINKAQTTLAQNTISQPLVLE